MVTIDESMGKQRNQTTRKLAGYRTHAASAQKNGKPDKALQVATKLAIDLHRDALRELEKH